MRDEYPLLYIDILTTVHCDRALLDLVTRPLVKWTLEYV